MANKPKVIAGYNEYPQTMFLQKAELILTGMTGNANFPTPIPSLTLITAATAAFAGFLNAPTSKENTAQKNQARAALTALLVKLGSYVQTTANGDMVKLLSSNFSLAKAPQKYGVLPPPEMFQVLPSYATEVKAKVKRVQGADMYNFAYTQTPVTDNNVWTIVNSTKTNVIISNLESGKQYAFKVAAKGAAPVIMYGNTINSYVL